ncbi:M20 family metallopeptidase [Nocardioides aestuarii]|uniref:M20 family metallopeptidase n=1 Tax=Nocardioides aestuarii TaxID=252231 RepID=A0ABW4TNA9_9ACTN
MSTVERYADCLERLVAAETPSSDADRLRLSHALLRGWGEPAFGRPPVERLVDGVPHLLWEPDPGSPHVLLLGHVDTVFAAGTTASRPFRRDGDLATGPGVFDMKAGLLIGLEAVATLADASRVAMLVTGDEEVGSVTSRALIEELASGATAVLVLEPSLGGAFKTSRKGGSIYDLVFSGRAAHAGLEPERGRNALSELARWALEVPQLADPALGTTVTPTVARAGTANNVVPDQAVLTLDVRARSMAELLRVDEAVRSRTPASGVGVTVRGGINRPPLEAGASDRLVGLCREVALELGLPAPRTAAVGGASDANFTAALGVETLDGLGPEGDGAHTEHEWVDLTALQPRARLVAGLIERLLEER